VENERAEQADEPVTVRRRAESYRLLLLPATILLLVAVLSTATTAATPPSPQNPIAAENRLAGSKGWESGILAAGPATAGEDDQHHGDDSRAARAAQGALSGAASGAYDPGPISAYTGQVSVDHGSPVDLYVSTSRPSYNVEVYRMGWYGGSGARLIRSYANLPGIDPGVPAPDPSTGLVDAHWAISLTIQTTTEVAAEHSRAAAGCSTASRSAHSARAANQST
jgi:hypothetical protein